MKIIKYDRFCPSCGSTIIQGENDGCNGPRSYTCEICGYSKYRAFPPTFPKRLKVKSREFAILYLQSKYTQSFNEVALEGFDVTGIDIEDAPNKLGYKHRFIQADIRSLNGKDYLRYDVIWGSTPCRNFTKLPDHGNRKDGVLFKWKVPKNPEAGLELVNAFLKLIEDVSPKFWILENVSGLANYLDLKPRAIDSKIKGGKRHVFYGNFPSLLIPQCEALQTELVQGKLRSWVRAKIPLSCSRAFARACKEALLEQEVLLS